MSKALAVLKLFFSLVSINSTAKPAITSPSRLNTTTPITQAAQPVPLLLTPMDQIASFVGQGFRFTIPDDTFYPTYYVGRRENLKLSMFTINGGEIFSNSWLRFDSESRNVYGFPLPGNEGMFRFLLRATNSDSKSVEDTLRVHVRKTTSNQNHEFVIRTNFHLLNFVSNVMVRFDLVSRLARHAIDEDIGSIWIKSYNRKRKQITFMLNTIPYSPCDKTQLINIYKKLASSSGGVHPSFQKALSEKFPISSVELKLFGPCNQVEKDDNDEFEWGVLKHLMPILMLMLVIGIPVSISVAIHKRIKKKRAKLRDERKRRRRMENGMDFTVHYNNRYPSMLSMSNNSKEDDAIEDERSSNSKMNIIPNGTTPNGTIPSINLAVPNTSVNKHNNNKLNTILKGHTVNLEEGKKANSSGSRVVFMGKSDMNIPVYFTKPKEEIKNDTDMSFSMIAESISSTLKGIGKSVWNVAGQQEEGTTANDPKTVNLDGASNKNDDDNKLKLLASELELPLAAEKNDVQKLQSVSIVHEPPQRSQSELKLTDYGKGNSTNDGVKVPLMNSTSSRLPKRRVSLPHIEIHSENTTNKKQERASFLGNSTQGSSVESGEGVSLKSLLKSLTDVSKAMTPKEQETVISEESSIGLLTSQIEQMSKDAREDFGSRNVVVCDPQDYGMQHSEKNLLEHEERYEDDDDLMTPEEIEAMDYTTWRIKQIKKAQRAAAKRTKKEQGMGNAEYSQDVEYSREEDASTEKLFYQEYTNPYHYARTSSLSVKTQSLDLTSQSSDSNWTDDYEKDNCCKQQRPTSPMYSPNTQSMPSLNDRKLRLGDESTKVDNRSKAQETNQQEDKSILGKIFSREKPEESKNLNQPEEPEEASLVGFLKTRVGGLLGPSEGSSWFK